MVINSANRTVACIIIHRQSCKKITIQGGEYFFIMSEFAFPAINKWFKEIEEKDTLLEKQYDRIDERLTNMNVN